MWKKTAAAAENWSGETDPEHLAERGWNGPQSWSVESCQWFYELLHTTSSYLSHFWWRITNVCRFILLYFLLPSVLSSQRTAAVWLRLQLDFLDWRLRLWKVYGHKEMQRVSWWEAVPSEQRLETQELRLRVAHDGWEDFTHFHTS